MKKLIFIIILLTCLTGISGVLADDCNILTDEQNTIAIDKHIDTITNTYEKKYINVLPAEALKQALINLKAYCCKKLIPQSCSSSDIANAPEHYPQSADLFDHLLDVAMRRLDGVQGTIDYNLVPDPTGSGRRTEITEIANSADGTPADTIQNLYTDYRTSNKEKLNLPKLDVILSKYNTDIATVSLRDKYTTLCDIMIEINNSIANTEKIDPWSDYYHICKNITTKRINKELGYVKILMVQKSNQLMDTTTKAYTQKYFVEEKLMALRNIIAKVKDIFQTIVQQAPASKTCSK